MALKEQHLILGIGELLWDLLPETPRLAEPVAGKTSPVGALGGAPANFAVIAGSLGSHAVILSRIGRDELGRRAVECLDPLPADISFLEVDPAHETGRVTVAFEGHEPHYTIHQSAAWDFLELTRKWLQLAERANAICFGSLAQRSLASRQTIQTLVAQTPASCVRVFDVNLRPPFYSGEVIQKSLELATVVKMNDAEAPQVLALLGLPMLPERQMVGVSAPGPLRRIAERLLDAFSSLQMVAVTRGAQGSLLVTRDEWHLRPGIPVKVADTIGAGDAFTAAMTYYMLRGAGLATLNEAGNRWGAWVASQPGAMHPVPDAVRVEIEAAIQG
jgi:fructokinase